MNRTVFASFILGLMLVAGPVPAQSVPAPPESAEMRHVVLPPELDRVLRDYEKAWRASDATALALLFSEDGFVLQSKRLPARGREAIKAAYEGRAGGLLRLDALAFSAGDTSGYIIGVYGYDNAPGDAGKFTLTLRRAPGKSWLIFSDMDNLNASPRSAQQ